MAIPENTDTARDKKHILRKIYRTGMETLVAAVILWILFIFASKFLCRKALENIGEKTGTRISVDLMRLNLNGSVDIEGLTVTPADNQTNEAIFKVQKAKVKISLPSMFLLKPQIKRISVNEITINLVYDSDNKKWNIPSSGRKRTPVEIDELPIIYLNNGTFTYSRIAGENKTVLARTLFRGLLISQNEPLDTILQKGQKVYHFELDAEQWSNFGSISLSGTIKQNRIEIRGSMLAKPHK